MKIVHCIFSFNVGGSETMLCDIISRQAHDNDVTLVVVNNDYDSKLLSKFPDNVSIIYLNRNPGSRLPFFIVRLNSLLRKLKPDVINLHSSRLPQIIFGLKDKLWYTVHALNIPMTYSGKLHGIIAISEAVKANIQDKCKCQIKVIPNGIDIDRIDRKTDYSVTDVFKIVQIGRLDHKNKGQDLLIKAIAKLKGEGLGNITVDFIGSGQSEEYLKQLAAELKVADQIRFLGLRDRDYIYSHLKDYDIMCHPSRYEGFGLVVAEGMAAGLPVCVSDLDGPFEIIDEGIFGYPFLSEDADELVLTLKEMVTEYDNCIRVANLAYDHIKANYSIDRMVKDYLAAYEQ